MRVNPSISIPLLFVEDLEAPVVDAQDRHHFEKVLRVKEGDKITISNGAGMWRECKFGRELLDLREIKTMEPPAPRLGIGFSPLKGGRSDLIVAKLTEVGVDYITPFYAERSVVRNKDEASGQLKRWEKIIRESGMQSRRVFLPQIYEPIDFLDLTEKSGVARCDMFGEAVPKDSADSLIQLCTHLLTGPEGGWSDLERKTLETEVSLGPNVLRSETAAILAGAVLVQARGW